MADLLKLDEAETPEEFLFRARYNAGLFDSRRFKRWLDAQTASVKKLAYVCPPDAVFEVVGDGRPAAIAGYKKIGIDDAAVVVAIFGEKHLTIMDANRLKKLEKDK